MEQFTVSALLAKGNYTTHLTNGLHEIIGDEPLDLGGQNMGFSPFELVLAGLALCKSATMRMYAERKGWDTGVIEVKVTMDFERDTPPLLLATVTFGANLEEEQKARLLQIADKCPAHKLLMGEKTIETKLA